MPATRPDCDRLSADVCDLVTVAVGLSVLGAQRLQVWRRDVERKAARHLESVCSGLRRANPYG